MTPYKENCQGKKRGETTETHVPYGFWLSSNWFYSCFVIAYSKEKTRIAGETTSFLDSINTSYYFLDLPLFNSFLTWQQFYLCRGCDRAAMCTQCYKTNFEKALENEESPQDSNSEANPQSRSSSRVKRRKFSNTKTDVEFQNKDCEGNHKYFKPCEDWVYFNLGWRKGKSEDDVVEEFCCNGRCDHNFLWGSAK